MTVGFGCLEEETLDEERADELAEESGVAGGGGAVGEIESGEGVADLGFADGEIAGFADDVGGRGVCGAGGERDEGEASEEECGELHGLAGAGEEGAGAGLEAAAVEGLSFWSSRRSL